MTTNVTDGPALDFPGVSGELLPMLDADPGPNWMTFALCQEVDPEKWFPERGASVRDAKRICRDCPVRAQCLRYALDHDERFGVWGGLSERERRRLKRAQQQPEGQDTAALRRAS
jgi:WhiB family redox-sensing transcriptional regulator